MLRVFGLTLGQIYFSTHYFLTTFRIVDWCNEKPGREVIRCLTQSGQPWSNQEIRVIGMIHEGQIQLRGEVTGVVIKTMF